MDAANTTKLDTIRKLLAKAEDPSVTEHEREAFNAKAAELMAKYGLEDALAANAAPGRDAGTITCRRIVVPAPFAMAKVSLAAVIATRYNITVLRTVGGDRDEGGRIIRLYGHEGDLELFDIMWTSLLVQAATGINRRVPGAGGAARTYRRNYILGFAVEVSKRMEAAQARAAAQVRTETAAGTDLVLADRKAAVDRYVRATVGRTTFASGPRVSDSGGFRDGRAAGARADLGGTRVGAGERRALNA